MTGSPDYRLFSIREIPFDVGYCNGKIKPKSCLVETYLDGPKDVGFSCPSPTYPYNDHCCCENGCCWKDCKKKTPPQSCLNGVPNSQWVKNPKKDNWIAVRNKKGSNQNSP